MMTTKMMLKRNSPSMLRKLFNPVEQRDIISTAGSVRFLQGGPFQTNPEGSSRGFWNDAENKAFSKVLAGKTLKISTGDHHQSDGQLQQEASVQPDVADGEKDGNVTLPRLELTGDPVKDQINKAKQQFATISPENHSCKDAFPAIEAALADGKVKPLFHALSLPQTFLKSQLSSSVVEAGEVDEHKKMVFDNKGKNLDDAVDVHGKGAASIIDYGMASPWNFDYEETAFAVKLVSTDAEMLGEDIECTDLKSITVKINAKEKSSELLTRPESRGVVSDVFHRFTVEADDGGSVAAITGLPGIGKSWTLFYALQQALLYDGATVLFFFQKQKYAVMYLRRNNKLYAWTSISTEAHSVLFMRPDVLVLLDPKDAGAQFALGEVKLLYAASNNKKHFVTAAEKDNGKMQAILGPPLEKELHVILARLDPQLEQDVIEERKQNVGNLIRYILDTEKYDMRKAIIQINVEACAADPILFQRAMWADGTSEAETTIGYDGQNVKYRERVVQAATDNVRNAILNAGRKVILSYWGKVTGAERVKMGDEVEKLVVNDLMNPDGGGGKIPSIDGETSRGEK
jgi:hypothetical protein